MKKTIFTVGLFLITFALSIFSCKKTDNNYGAGGGSSTTSGTTAGSGNPSGTYNGFLVTLMAPTQTFTFSTGIAYFFNSPTSIAPGTKIVGTASVTSVSMNSTQFVYSSSNMEYSDQTFALNFPPATWNVTGAGVIPSFTYTNSDLLPVYNGIASLPATINKTQNLVIPLSGISGADQVEIDINDSLNKTTSVFVAAGSASATILKDSLAKLTPCSSGSINVSLIKYNSQTVAGKPFLFATLKLTSKNNIVIH